MNPQNKNYVLAGIGIIIIAAIAYIEIHKAPTLDRASIQNIALTADTVGSSTEATSTSSTTTSTTVSLSRTNALKAKAAKYDSAKELIPGPEAGATGVAATGFINADPFTLKSLIGNKVVLIDFWTYSCINCQRTIPYLNAWYAKYKDYGLEIVGVHTPEFDFEKDYGNVSTAVKAAGIQYPVVQDNNSATWQAYNNQYWPREYLVDIDGYIVHDKIGEGDYADTEAAIQAALQERANILHTGQTIPTGTVTPSNAVGVDMRRAISPETYFGAHRNSYLANGTTGTTGSQNLSLPTLTQPKSDSLYLSGTWNFTPEYAEVTSSPDASGIAAKVLYSYTAKNVYIVAAADTAVAPQGVRVKVIVDGKPVTDAMRGTDVAADGTITIQANTLYNLLKDTDYNSHTLELDVLDKGLEAFTFTFG